MLLFLDMNKYSNIQEHLYYRSHSVSSKSSSICSDTNERKKCSNCSVWLNLSRIFEFLITGTFDDHVPTESFDFDLSHLYYLTDNLKYIRNPIDPSEKEDFLWDFKSPLHYKLLKLKLKLIVQIDQFIKIYQTNETTCKKCSKESKNFLIFKSFSINKLVEYSNNLRPILERFYDRFAHHRLKNSFEINTVNDFNLFLRNKPPGFEPMYDPNLNYVESCASKIHNLLDLLIYDEVLCGRKRFDSKVKNENEVCYDVELDMDVLEPKSRKKKKRNESESSYSNVSDVSEVKKKKKKKPKKSKLEETKIQSSSLITEIRKNKDKKRKKEVLTILVDFNLDSSESEHLEQLFPIIGYKLTNFNIDEYIEDYRIKLDLVKSYYDAIEKYSENVKSDTSKPDDDDFESKTKLMFKILNEIQSRLKVELCYLDKIYTCLKEFSLDQLESQKKYIYIHQLELVEIARTKCTIEPCLSSMGIACLLDILERFVSLYDI